MAKQHEPKQVPGCLPDGFDLDSMLTPQQFCLWQQVQYDWFRIRKLQLPGVIIHGRKMVRVHPRTFLQFSLKRPK